VSQEFLQHRAAARLEKPPSPGAIPCEICEPSFIQLRNTQAMPIKPAAQVSKNPKFVPGIDPAIALLEKKPSEPVDVTAQWSSSETLDSSWVLEKLSHHTLSTSATGQLDAH